MGGGWTKAQLAGPGIAPAGGRPPGPLAPTGGDALNALQFHSEAKLKRKIDRYILISFR